MEEDDNYIIKVERKPLYGDFVAFLFLFGTFFITLFCFMAGWYLICLSILAFAVIIVLLVRRGIRNNKIIVSDFKENKEPKVALNEKNENISKNTDVLRGKEEAEVTLSDSINIPENYIPKTEPKKPVGYYSFLSYDMRDFYREIVELIIVSIFLISMIPWLSESFFLGQSSFDFGFSYSFLLCIIAFWKFRTVYFKKGWVKVLAKPNNVLEEQFSGGGGDGFVPTDVIVTEGWTFFVDGQQYNIKKPSSIHYKKEREIYWHPITNNLIVRNWPAKVLLFLYLFAANIFFNVGLALLLNQPTDEVYIANLIVLFGLVLPTSVIIFSEMYINKKTLEDIIAFLILSALGFAVLYLASLVLG